MLRDYQQEIYNEIRDELKTHEGVCAVLPCRSGKSYIMKAIVDSACEKGNNVLILAHRHLLINQHKRLINNCRIASVFTEVNHLGENGSPDLIIIDEAHLSGAESYQKICRFYQCKRVLFTATAKRLDNKPLDLASTVINGISGDELIKRGDVSAYNLYAPKLNIDISSVSMSGSDFNNEQLGDIMLDKKIYGDIIKYYRKHIALTSSIVNQYVIYSIRQEYQLFTSMHQHLNQNASKSCKIINHINTQYYAIAISFLRVLHYLNVNVAYCSAPHNQKRCIFSNHVGV